MRLKKKCSLCKKNKLLSEYWKHIKARDGMYAHCKSCHTLQSRKTRQKYREKYREKARKSSAEWRKKNPEIAKERNKIYREKYKEKYNQKRREKSNFIRLEVIKNYGGKCKCCEEKEVLFLALDHVNNDGNLHRKNIRKNLAEWAHKNNYPKNIQLLCHNCNYGKHLNKGICPHQLNI